MNPFLLKKCAVLLALAAIPLAVAGEPLVVQSLIPLPSLKTPPVVAAEGSETRVEQGERTVVAEGPKGKVRFSVWVPSPAMINVADRERVEALFVRITFRAIERTLQNRPVTTTLRWRGVAEDARDATNVSGDQRWKSEITTSIPATLEADDLFTATSGPLDTPESGWIDGVIVEISPAGVYKIESLEILER